MNATLTSMLRVYDDKNPAAPLVDTADRAEIASSMMIRTEANDVFYNIRPVVGCT